MGGAWKGEGQNDFEKEVKSRTLLEKSPKEVAKGKRLKHMTTPGAYADDIQTSGTVSQCLGAYVQILKKGPAYGVRLCERKTKLVVHEADSKLAEAMIKRSSYPTIEVVTAARNLGSVTGFV